MSTETTEQIPFHVAVFDDPDMSLEQKVAWLKETCDHYYQAGEKAMRAVSVMRGGFQVIEKACKGADPAKVLREDIPAICGVALRATEQTFGFELHERQRAAKKETQEPPNTSA